jgi:hypothetical protein
MYDRLPVGFRERPEDADLGRFAADHARDAARPQVRRLLDVVGSQPTATRRPG